MEFVFSYCDDTFKRDQIYRKSFNSSLYKRLLNQDHSNINTLFYSLNEKSISEFINKAYWIKRCEINMSIQ